MLFPRKSFTSTVTMVHTALVKFRYKPRLTDKKTDISRLALPLAILASVLIFLGIHGLLSISLINTGTVLDERWMIQDENGIREVGIPYIQILTEQNSVVISTELPGTKGLSLVVTGLNATALTARVDGKVVLILGDHKNATANLWNSMIVIPLEDSPQQGRILEFKMTGHQRLSLARIPFLEDTAAAQYRVSLHRFFYHDMVLFFMGSSVMIGVILIGFSMPRRPRRWDGILLGASALFIAIYATDFTFRYSTGSFPVYNILKRLIIGSSYFASFSFLAGLDLQANKEFRTTRWMAIPTLVAVLLILFAPSIGVLNQRLLFLNPIILVNLTLVIVIVIRKMRKRILYVVAAGLLFLAIVEIMLIMTVLPYLPAVLQYLVVIASILIGLQFLLDYREVYLDRENLRKVYDKDALTGAYNRRAMDSIDFREFNAAVFLDFDLFKLYNDTFGHDKGDILLRDFVRVAHNHLRRRDLVVRYGGDEFLILLGEADEVLARVIVERIREAFRALVPDTDMDISYGIDSVGADGQLDVVILDKRMYAMKQQKKRS